MAVSERRQREREARRQCILDAAERLIEKNGLWATTMEDVAGEAELSKGTLYLYFDNRDALCAALAERSMGAQLSDFRRRVLAKDRGIDRLRTGMEFYVELARTHPHLLRMAATWLLSGIQCAPDAPDILEYRKRLGQVVGLMVEAIELGQRDGTIRRGVEPKLLAVQIWAGMLGTFIVQHNREDLFRRLPFSIDADGLIPLYVDNLLRGIAGPNAGKPQSRPDAEPKEVDS